MVNDTTRLFFALWPSDAVRNTIEAACQPVVQQADGKPVAPANYHITLAFLGSVPRVQLADVIAVARAVQFQPFTLQLDHTGYWPRSRIAWLRPTEHPAKLTSLVADLWAGLTPLGLVADSRTFQPHVSLVRGASAGLSRPLSMPVEWPADGFALASSAPGLPGAGYDLLERFAVLR